MIAFLRDVGAFQKTHAVNEGIMADVESPSCAASPTSRLDSVNEACAIHLDRGLQEHF